MASITGKIAFAVTAGLLLTGCGTDPANSTTTATTRSAPPVLPDLSGSGSPPQVTTIPAEPAPAAVPKCTNADVQGAFSAPDNAMGTHGARIIITNTSAHACTIYGYGGLEMFAGDDGRPANIVLNRVPYPEPSLVTLQPGGKANKSLTWKVPDAATGDVSDPSDSPACTPDIGFASVILPDDTQAFIVEGNLGQVCNNREVDSRAYAAGEL